jgi:hypothetical protein
MRLARISVRNFRSLADATLELGDLTALLGRNGSGKSAFLHALDLFYSATRRVTVEDFYDRDTERPVEIAVEFRDLPRGALELFGKYLDGGSLTVEKVIHWTGTAARATYHGATLQNPAFQTLRDALEMTDRAVTAKACLQELRGQPEYTDLPAWTTKGGVAEAVREWEEQHPTSCERSRDEGQFFGFNQVAQGYLGRYTRLLFIPAVREANADAVDGRASVFTELLDLVVRNEMAQKEAIREVEEDFAQRVEEVLAPERNPELENLASELSVALGVFVPSAEVQLDWLPLEPVTIPLPRANLRLVEDGYPAPVDRCGHGLQRAFVLTMLQRLAVAQGAGDHDETAPLEIPNLVLVVEEPELYQHPNRQRHFARILSQLARGETPGVAQNTQIVYATHSPLFVSVDRFEQVRLLRKVSGGDDMPKVTSTVRADMASVAEHIWHAAGRPEPRFTADTLRPRLTAVMTPWMNEGFFADLAVLVEGEDDKAAIHGMAAALGVDFEALGVSVIPCHGKTNLDKPAAIFASLGIPIFVVWDSDEHKDDQRPELNHHLLRLLGCEVEDWPHGVGDRHGCFRTELERQLRDDLRDDYDALLAEAQEAFAIPQRQFAIKKPDVIRRLIERGRERGHECELLRDVVSRIVEVARDVGVALPPTPAALEPEAALEAS